MFISQAGGAEVGTAEMLEAGNLSGGVGLPAYATDCGDICRLGGKSRVGRLPTTKSRRLFAHDSHEGQKGPMSLMKQLLPMPSKGDPVG